MFNRECLEGPNNHCDKRSNHDEMRIASEDEEWNEKEIASKVEQVASQFQPNSNIHDDWAEMLENNKQNMKLMRMKKMKTEINFTSLNFSHMSSNKGVEEIPLENCDPRHKMTRSASSRDMYLRQRSSLLHDIILTLGFASKSDRNGRPWKIVVEPWTKERKK